MNQAQLMTVLQAPHVSEKAVCAADTDHAYVFRVDSRANKHDVKQAVELMFDVKVHKVNVLNRSGKQKRFGGRIGQQTGYKKAYVTLVEGNEIHFGDEGGK